MGAPEGRRRERFSGIGPQYYHSKEPLEGIIITRDGLPQSGVAGKTFQGISADKTRASAKRVLSLLATTQLHAPFIALVLSKRNHCFIHNNANMSYVGILHVPGTPLLLPP